MPGGQDAAGVEVLPVALVELQQGRAARIVQVHDPSLQKGAFKTRVSHLPGPCAASSSVDVLQRSAGNA